MIISLVRLIDPGWVGCTVLIISKHISEDSIQKEWSVSSNGRKQRARERQNPKHGAQHRDRTHNPEIMTWTKIKSQMLNQQSHPGTREVAFKALLKTNLHSDNSKSKFCIIIQFNPLLVRTWFLSLDPALGFGQDPNSDPSYSQSLGSLTFASFHCC